MNRGFILVALLGITLSIGLWPLARPYFPRTVSDVKNALPLRPESTTSVMTLTSPDVVNSGSLPIPHTCDGRGISPELNFSHVPSSTAEIVVTMTDLDSKNGIYYHWGLWHIPAGTTTIPAGSIPTSAMIAKNSAGTKTYAPACPPSGEHRYVFIAYALRAPLSLPENATVQQVKDAATLVSLTSASLISRYRR